ncbi:ATP-binding protein [Marivirga salinae]|uniref:ATP-binding protein n=1 Tax=Marivirga salinarum TaxID=3059078 RepID=A0AA51NEN2_9BACT|nr:RNA-binding domain-containing protein [Marivirga sp. BDSF4-3]WMN13030.1 ATP-binding protein [Marivirga sp. BDSF4-3]
MISENNRIEFKEKLTDELEREVVAFLNSREGGYIYLGISASGQVKGIRNSDEVQLKIKDRLKNNIQPSCLGLFDIVSEDLEGQEIIKIIIAAGLEKPYFLRKFGMSPKGSFMRVGSATEPLNQRQIEDFFSKRIRNSISKIKSNKQELSFEQLKIYYEERGLKLNKNYAQNLELLTEDGQFNYVAYLLSDVNGNSIKLAIYNGIDRVDLVENNEYGYCSLIKATKQVLDKLAVENKISTKITSKERENRPVWDSIAIREAVINAIIHNDYTNEVPPKFEIFDDRIEITSNGGLPAGINKKEFFEGISIPRNKELMRIFKDLDMVEQLGSGIPRILRIYPKNIFNISENYIRMSFPKEISDSKPNNDGGVIGGAIGGAIGGVVEELTARQLEVLKAIHENNRITYKALSESFGIAESAVSKHIDTLKEKGVLKREGGTRGFWRLINPDNN